MKNEWGSIRYTKWNKKMDIYYVLHIKIKKIKKGEGKVTIYLWYNGSTSYSGGEKVGKTKVKAKREKRPD